MSSVSISTPQPTEQPEALNYHLVPNLGCMLPPNPSTSALNTGYIRDTLASESINLYLKLEKIPQTIIVIFL